MALSIGEIEAVLKARDELTGVLKKAQTELGKLSGSAATTGAALTAFSKRATTLGSDLSTIGRTLSIGVSAPMALLGAVAIKSAMDFESSFAGVRKTVDATEEEFAQLSDGFRDLSKEIPTSVNALNAIGEAAGQLGIQNENILSFTRIMADLGATTNLSADQAASSLARLANITQMPQDQFDRLGSTIVALGNNMATTEAEITEFGLRIAGAGEQAGLSEAEILSIGAAMSSVGVEAEAGGTAVQKVLLGMTQAVATGSEELGLFAEAAGMTAEQFSEAFKTDAAGAFTSFVEGLKAAGTDAFVILENLGMTDQRLMRGFLALSGAGDLLRNSIELGTQAWEENTALAEEARKRYETTASQLAILKNEAVDAAITLGGALVPALRSLIAAGTPLIDWLATGAEWFAALPQPIQTTAVAIGGLIAVLGPAVFLVGATTSALGKLAGTGLFTALVAGFTTTTVAVDSTTIAMALYSGTSAPAATTATLTLASALGTLWAALAAVAVAWGAWKVGTLIGELEAGGPTVTEWVSILWNWKLGLGETDLATLKLAESSRRLAKELKDAAPFAALLAKEQERLWAAVSVDDSARAVTVTRDLGKATKKTATDTDALADAAERARDEFGRLRTAIRSLEIDAFGQQFRLLPSYMDQLGQSIGRDTSQLLEMVAAFEALNVEAERLKYWGLPAYMADLGRKLPIPQMQDLAQYTAEAFQGPPEALREGIEDTSASLSGLAQAFGDLAQISEGSFGNVARSLSTVVGSINAGRQAGQRMKSGWTELTAESGNLAAGLANIAVGAMAAVAALDSATQSTSTFQNTLAGASTGAQIGGQIGGGWGAAIGGAFGALYGFIKSKTDETLILLRNAERAATEAFRDYGVNISQELATRIALAAREMVVGVNQLGDTVMRFRGRMDASLLYLSDIIAESGGVTFSNLTMWTSRTRDLFSALERGSITAGQAMTQLDAIFPQLASHIAESGGLASSALLELIDLNDRLGTNSQEITDFIVEQLQEAATGLNAMFEGLQESATAGLQGPFDIAIDRAELLRTRLEDFDTTGMSQDAIDAITDQIDELDVFIERTTDYRDSLVGTFIATEQQARGLGAAVVGTFGKMLASGESFSDALEALQPSIDTLQAQLELTGFTGGAAFEGLAYLALQAADPIVGPLLDAVTGVNQALQGLHNSGILNQEMFEGLAFTAMDAFNQMIANGVNADAAMMMMQPALQTLWQLSNDFNYSLTEEEEQLVENAAAAGMVGDRFRDASDRMARSMERVVEVLELIAQGMGFDVTQAAADAGEAGSDAMGETEDATDAASDAVNELTFSIERTIAELNNLDTQPFDDIVTAANAAADAVNRLNFGSSPGGLKEIPLLLDRGIARALAFASVMSDVSQSSLDGIRDMTDGMEDTIRALGLMYAFADGDFGDFLFGDEKRLKEAGLYEFWKDWREQMSGATDDALTFARVMNDVTSSAVDGLMDMTDEMTEVITSLGLMYAFAENFDDFAIGDEKRLKEAGLYDFWQQWMEQFFGGGGEGGGDGEGAGGTNASLRMPGLFSGVNQTIIVNLDRTQIAREMVREMPRQIQVYTR